MPAGTQAGSELDATAATAVSKRLTASTDEMVNLDIACCNRSTTQKEKRSVVHFGCFLVRELN